MDRVIDDLSLELRYASALISRRGTVASTHFILAATELPSDCSVSYGNGQGLDAMSEGK